MDGSESGDFVTDFIEATEGLSSPMLFRKWTGISIVGAALERRVWVRTGQYQTFPNLYVQLVASPGVGKQVLDRGRELVGGLPEAPIHLAPNSTTKASLVDQLAKAGGKAIAPDGTTTEYHSLYIMAEDMQLFMPSYDGDFLGVLVMGFNNQSLPFTETRRYGKVQDLIIPLPQINMICGVQPAWLAGTMPDIAWDGGFMARTIMVYVEEDERRDLFAVPRGWEGRYMALGSRLIELSKLFRELRWDPTTAEKLNRWHKSGGGPLPEHSRLKHYNQRRTQFVIKLALISAVSRGELGTISPIDLERAWAWLFEVEEFMPDVFRAMKGRTDQFIIEELHMRVTALWKMNGGKAVPRQTLRVFVNQFANHDKIEKLIDMAVAQNVLDRVAGTEMFLPRPKHLHGVE